MVACHGCLSGPFILNNEALDITLNPYSWNVAANVLCVNP